MGMRYGIVGYNGPRKIKRPKSLPPKPVKEDPAIVVEDTIEVVTVKEEIPEVIEPEVFEKICESVVEAGDLKEEVKEELTKLWVEEKPKPRKKRKYKKRRKASTVTSSSTPEVLVLPAPASPEVPPTD